MRRQKNMNAFAKRRLFGQPRPASDLPIWLVVLLILLLASMATGCASGVGSLPGPQVQANLRTECPEALPQPRGATGADLLAWATAVRAQYNVCADRHKRLVDALHRETAPVPARGSSVSRRGAGEMRQGELPVP